MKVTSDGWKGVALASALAVTNTYPRIGCGSVDILVMTGAHETSSKTRRSVKNQVRPDRRWDDFMAFFGVDNRL